MDVGLRLSNPFCRPIATGSSMHIDPVYTGAWNTLTAGAKKWVLFPPGNDAEYKDAIGEFFLLLLHEEKK